MLVVHAAVVDREFLTGRDVADGMVGHVAVVGAQVGVGGVVHVPAGRDAQEVERHPISPGAANAELLVEGGVARAVDLTADQVAQLFTGKADTFPGGGKAVPIDQAEGSADRNAFHAKVTGKDAAQLKAYWSKLIFAGKGQPPKEVASGADVKKAVAADPAAIGYLDKSLVDGSIKVVLAP